MSDLQKSILVVDDEPIIAELWCMYVEDMGLHVCGTAATADAAVALAIEHRPAVVLMDVRLHGEKDGVDAAEAIFRLVGSKVIFITGSREPATIARMQMDHPADILFKPVSDRQMRVAITTALLP